jgi:threonine dehydrogenase-like Zn-dependent dehydrogenase
MCARVAVPAGNLYPAEGLSADQAALVEFLAIAAHAVRRSEMTGRDRSGIIKAVAGLSAA